MKKIISFLLIAIIAAFPMCATAAPGDAILLRSGTDELMISVRGMTLFDGSVCVLTYDGLISQWLPGATQSVTYETRELFSQEETDEDILGNYEIHALCAWQDRLCAVVSESLVETYGVGEDTETFSTVEKIWLQELLLDGQGSASLGEELSELDWYDLIAGGDYEYINSVENAFVQDGSLIFSSYDSSGNSFIASTALEDGSTDMAYLNELLLDNAQMCSICAYKGGKILMCAMRWNEESTVATLYAVDIKAREAEELFALPDAGFSSPFGLVYREDADALYYCRQGEICVITGMNPETAQSVAAVPINNASATPVVTDDGLYYIADHQTVVRRNTDPSQRAQKRLTVQSLHNETIERAYYAFANERGDVEVRLIDQAEELVQAMMNRSSAVDIYCIESSSSEFDAVFGRGYMAELNKSDKISALLESCYPAVREVCMREGVPVAIPVSAYTNDALGYSPEALKALGMTEDELPCTWAEFFKSLSAFAQKIESQPGVSLFETYMDENSARTTLFYTMISQYLAYVSQPEQQFAFDTPEFREIIAAYEAVDWKALGLAQSAQDGEDAVGIAAMGDSGEGKKPLFYSYSSVSAHSYAYEAQRLPLLLGMAQGEQPILQMQVQVAFVNPYSENLEDAVAFLETAIDAMEPILAVHISPENNEPIRSPYYESNIASFEEHIAMLENELKQAEDGEKEDYAQMLKQSREDLEEYERTGAWEASEQSITYYREYAPYFVAVRNTGITGDTAFYTLQEQYLDGMISSDEMIDGIDGKLQMMMLEGM